MASGILSQISFGQESTWGTAVVPDKSIAVRPGDGIQTDNNVQFVQSIKAQLAKNASSFKGATVHEGEYEMDFIPGVVGFLLKSAFGSIASAAKGGDATVYDHTFTEAETKPSLTIEQAVGDITRRYAGAIVTSIGFSCAQGEALTANVGIKARTTTSATKISPTYETMRPFNFADMGATGFQIGGTSYVPQNFELTYNNNVELLHALGSNDPQNRYTTGSEVTGRFELYLNSTVAGEYSDYLNKTDQSLAITFTGDQIGSSSNYGLAITVPKVSFTSATYPINDDYVNLSVEFEGIYDTATSRLINMVLTNLTANYN